MPSMWQWYVRARAEECELHHLHAAVCDLVDGDATHDLPTKPFAISPPEPLEGGCRIELRLLSDGPTWVAHVLDQFGVAAMRGVRLGNGCYATEPLVPVRARTWANLASDTPDKPEFTIDFLSPFYVRDRNRQLPLPLPGSILRSLVQKWSVFAPEHLPPLELRDVRIDIADLKGETVTARCGRVTHTGFLGTTKFRIGHRQPDIRGAVQGLLAAAPYTGLGSSTTYGFGTVEVG